MRRLFAIPILLVGLASAQAQVVVEEAGAGPGDVRRTITLAFPAEQKSTWLGVMATPAPPAVCEQLKLPRGVGLVVENVVPDSPAAKAGLKARDLLHKLDDQLLFNQAQLSALVRSMKPDDEVALAVFREGAATTIKTKLTQSAVWEMPVPPPGAMPGAPADVLFLRADAANDGGAGPRRIILRGAGGMQSTTWSDKEHTLTMERENGVTKKVIVIDVPSGKELFNGPIDTPEQRQALPKGVEAKLKRAELTADYKIAIGNAGMMPGVRGGGAWAAGRSKVSTWQDDRHILIIRSAAAPTYLLALSRKTGQILFEGPVATQEQRQAIPAEIADILQTLANKPEMAKEFGK